MFADPTVIRDDDGTYYAYGTSDYSEWNGTTRTAYIPMLSSKDMVTWKYEGDVFTASTRPDWKPSNFGIWAPDIVKIGNTYNLYYSFAGWGDAENSAIGVATAEHPLGPWRDRGCVITTPATGVKSCIDSFTFEYEGGVYMIWGSFYGIYMVELTSDGLQVKDMATKSLIGGTEGSCAFEGSYMIERDGTYYLFLSLGHCCQGIDSTYVNVVKSSSPFGPWVDREGKTLLGKKTLGELVVKGGTEVTGPGHNAVIKDDAGDYWIVYHGYEVKYTLGHYGSSPRRSLFIDKLLWDEDGFPYVEGNAASYNKINAPVIKK